MADLGAIGKRGNHFGLRINNALPICRAARNSGDRARSYLDHRPVSSFVTDPIPVAGVVSIECYTPGTETWEIPVDAGQSVSVSVKFRKNAQYVVSGQSGLGGAVRSLLPYLELDYPTTAKRKRERQTMTDLTDTWVTVSIGPIVVAVTGVVLARAVVEGNFGDNMVFVEESKRPGIPGPKAWIADLSPTVTGP